MDTMLIEKIQKLLNLSESSNENEAKAAMLKAQELVIKHKLSMQEVKNIKIYNSKIKENKSNISFTKAKWKGKLASLIAENFGCYIFLKVRRTNTITFFGREEDVMVCNIVLRYAIDCISNNVKKVQYKNRKFKYSTKGIENDYAIGFIKGLSEKFESQKRNNQEWGLILTKDKEVVEAYEEIKFTKSLNTDSKFQGNSEAYEQGVEDGEQFSISDKIAREGQEVLKIG